MRSALAFVAFGFCVALACGGKVDVSADGGPLGDGALPDVSGQCCPASPQPGCCMSYGGFAQGNACSQQCDGMPSPGDPGWHLDKDSHGCSIWIQPANPTSFCGQKPPDQCPTPADVSMFTPAPLHPNAVAKVCSAAQITGYYTTCFDSTTSTAQTCQAFVAANGACTSCVVTPDTASSWGAVIGHQGYDEINTAGCIALVTGDASITSCAQKTENALECEIAACDQQCPISDGSSFQAHGKCTNYADQNGCAKYVAAECATDAGALAQCSAVDFKTMFTSVATLFCGTN